MNNSNILRESADFLNHIYKMAMTTTKWTIILGVGVSDVGKCIYEDSKLGSILTIGEINRKLINIRPGICKNNDDE